MDSGADPARVCCRGRSWTAGPAFSSSLAQQVRPRLGGRVGRPRAESPRRGRPSWLRPSGRPVVVNDLAKQNTMSAQRASARGSARTRPYQPQAVQGPGMSPSGNLRKRRHSKAPARLTVREWSVNRSDKGSRLAGRPGGNKRDSRKSAGSAEARCDLCCQAVSPSSETTEQRRAARLNT